MFMEYVASAYVLNNQLKDSVVKIEEDIEKVKIDYFACLKYPRKKKKQYKKELLSRYSLLLWMKDNTMQFTF